MIFKVAVRSLTVHPVRSVVLACGFGLGVGVMAMLLGVGAVILDQARSPALVGGGDLVVTSATGQVSSARWILSSALRGGELGARVTDASPTRRATLYLIRDGRRVPIRVRGGIPSLERGVGDPETAPASSWADTDSDRAWASPDPAVALRDLDRFHPIPNVPARADSWAEWLYFNGRAGSNRFYLTFLVGPTLRSGIRAARVRLQLDTAGQESSYSAAGETNDLAVVREASDLTIDSSRVRLEGMRYHLMIDLPIEKSSSAGRAIPDSRVRGDLFIEASPGRALPPLSIQGAGGWLSGYVVPVMSGGLTGKLIVNGKVFSFDGGIGYHDHNWGFWKDVSWRWGQVQYENLSVVYGRIYPPADAADPERIPGFMAVLSPQGTLGYSTNISIDQTDDPATGQPRRIVIKGRSSSLDLILDLAPDNVVISHTAGGSLGGGLDFLQLGGRYLVRGTAGGRSIDFTAAGSAETFRGRR
jgi:hypothetical protein